jgi:hypothetical protein
MARGPLNAVAKSVSFVDYFGMPCSVAVRREEWARHLNTHHFGL